MRRHQRMGGKVNARRGPPAHAGLRGVAGLGTHSASGSYTRRDGTKHGRTLINKGNMEIAVRQTIEG